MGGLISYERVYDVERAGNGRLKRSVLYDAYVRCGWKRDSGFIRVSDDVEIVGRDEEL